MKKFSYLTVDIWYLLPKVGELRIKPKAGIEFINDDEEGWVGVRLNLDLAL